MLNKDGLNEFIKRIDTQKEWSKLFEKRVQKCISCSQWSICKNEECGICDELRMELSNE